mgnify:CR=1 FL=1
MNRSRSTALVLALLTRAALADAPPDAEFLAAKVVAVQPTDLLAQDGSARAQALAAMVVAPLDRTSVRALAALGLLALPEREEGFGFAGASDAGDVVALQAGYVVGRIATHASAGDLASVRTMGRWVEARQGALDFLSPTALEALTSFVGGALDGRVDAGSVVALLQSTESGIASGPARGHGYFAAGVWAGMALLGSASETGRANVLSVGTSLIAMLEQDAAFDASDRTIADRLKTIARELSSDGPRLQAIAEEGRALMAIRADSEQ